MATLEELVVSLVAETSGLRAELEKATKVTTASAAKMESAVKDFTENSSNSLTFWQSSLASMTGFLGSSVVTGAFNLLKDGVKFLADELLKGAESAIAEEKALTKLANSLALTGQFTDSAIKDLTDFASAMEKSTGVADDVIASNLAVLSSLTKLDSQGLQQAQSAALDLASVLNVDLNTATTLVAKGINGNVGAFSKYGFEVDASTTKTEGLANVLKGLSGIQGSASGAMKTFDGQLLNVKNSYGNLLEQYSLAIIKNLAFTRALEALSGALDGSTKDAKEQDTALRVIAGETLVFMIDALVRTVRTMDLFGRIGKGAIALIQESFYGLGAVITGVLSLASDKFDASFNEYSRKAEEANKAVENSLTDTTALETIAVKLEQVGVAATAGLGEVKKGMEAAVAPTVKARDAVVELTAAETARLDQLKGFATALAEQGAAVSAEYAFEQEQLQIALDGKLISEQDYFVTKNELQLAQYEFEQSELQAARDKNLITEKQYQDAKMALERKQQLDSMKATNDKRKFDELTDKEKLAAQKKTLGEISTLASSSNKELAAIGKAAAIAQATIDGYAAVQSAFANVPYPYNFAAAALVGAATLQNIAKIKSVNMNSGGRVPGVGLNQDSVPASLTPGESVIDRADTQRLSRFLDAQENGGGGSAKIEITMNENLIEFIETRILERQRIGISILGAV